MHDRNPTEREKDEANVMDKHGKMQGKSVKERNVKVPRIVWIMQVNYQARRGKNRACCGSYAQLSSRDSGRWQRLGRSESDFIWLRLKKMQHEYYEIMLQIVE